MNISSRTPEGSPNRCTLCGAEVMLEPSLAGDGPCPACNQLLWWFAARRADGIVDGESDHDPAPVEGIRDTPVDFLDLVEWVMEVEDEFDIDIPDEVARELKTVEDVVRYLRSCIAGRGEPGAGADE